MNYKEAVIEANRRADNNYLGKDEDGFAKYRIYLNNFAVHIVHEEGTNLFFESANAERVDNWWFIYTEHHGVFVYDEDDVLIYKYKRIDNEEIVDVEEDLRRKIDELEDKIYWMKQDKYDEMK